MNNIPFPTTTEEQTHKNTKDTVPSSIKAPGKPGWEIKLTSNKAPTKVSAELDESNIIQFKLPMNMRSINHNSPNPKNWRKSMCSPDRAAWIAALKKKLDSL
ncbi:hypothetical protein O181_016142 [Austropuccinia psidii MF-1]|uniref:Uncharacterized protein n=1 Tax=Austropuccinia psidii MF-1 TaxID=1389203 RepID=A0A9Q3GRE3_9BASI|nr:hypothetical protein [Austropuccinia psidii MF-1]